MAKRVLAALLDAALNVIKVGITGNGPANKQVVCSAEPTTYTEANSTYKLAEVTMTGTDFTLANGDGAGNTPRKCTVAQKTGVSVGTSGTATHVALIDTINGVLLEVTTCTSQALTSGNTVTIPAWKIELGAPT